MDWGAWLVIVVPSMLAGLAVLWVLAGYSAHGSWPTWCGGWRQRPRTGSAGSG